MYNAQVHWPVTTSPGPALDPPYQVQKLGPGLSMHELKLSKGLRSCLQISD